MPGIRTSMIRHSAVKSTAERKSSADEKSLTVSPYDWNRDRRAERSEPSSSMTATLVPPGAVASVLRYGCSDRTPSSWRATRRPAGAPERAPTADAPLENDRSGYEPMIRSSPRACNQTYRLG